MGVSRCCGSAGGIILLWDYSVIKVLDSWCGGFSVSAWVEDSDYNSRRIITSVYGPNYSQRRVDFLKEWDAIRGR